MRLENMLKRPMTLLLTVDRILAATAVKMDGYDKRDIIVRPSSGPERWRDCPTCYRGHDFGSDCLGDQQRFPGRRHRRFRSLVR
jgi:hypothetical protein